MATPRRRASDHVRARPEGLLGRLRLRHKLGVILVVAALLPVLGASTVAIRLVLSGLQQGSRAQSERTLRVALNLMLGHVKEVFDEAVRLSQAPNLSETLFLEPTAVGELLGQKRDDLLPGLVEVADADGKMVARIPIGREGPRAAALAVGDHADAVKSALAYERKVTLTRPGQGATGLVVRASTPVLDEGFRLRGAIVVSVPLDAEFADRLKAQLSADVVVYQDEAPSASSFMAEDGRREVGFAAPTEVSRRVLSGDNRVVELPAFGRLYSVGYAPLEDIEGHRLGMLAVAVDEDALVAARSQAWRSLGLGGASALVFALALAALLSRRLTRPLGHLHAGAIAVARGDLDHRIVPETGDEIGDLAVAFAQMTRGLKENRDRLAARMREIVTLHDIGRAVSSVLALDEVLKKIAEEVAGTLGAQHSALLLAADDGALSVGAAVGLEGQGIVELAEAISWRGGPVRIEDVGTEVELKVVAAKLGIQEGWSLLAVPLEQKEHVIGMLLCARPAPPFGDTDLRLLATFAHQASTAVVNARLYDQVQRASAELEAKVKARTAELTEANGELERALVELRQAQSALVHSERMAGLGQLVAGVAHEVNSPAAAVQGAVDNLGDNVRRLARRARELGELRMDPEDRMRFFALVEQLAPHLATARIEAPAQMRRQARELAQSLAQHGLEGVNDSCRTLVEIGAAEAAFQIAQLATRAAGAGGTAEAGRVFGGMVGYVEEYAYLFRNTHAIRTAIQRITRIVGALKGYSHLDEAKVTPADIHEGIENTLIILHHELKYGINITRSYAQIPPVPVYVDELNQVWTNLIHNAVQALGGKGDIRIETELNVASGDGDQVVISIEDSGSGIAPEVMPRIFEPFFTTKPKGEGTGLGLGIVQQIVKKHGGRIEVTSRPGCTRFSVVLPVAGPPQAPGNAAPETNEAQATTTAASASKGAAS